VRLTVILTIYGGASVVFKVWLVQLSVI
jgi:hypothetical protein